LNDEVEVFCRICARSIWIPREVSKKLEILNTMIEIDGCEAEDLGITCDDCDPDTETE